MSVLCICVRPKLCLYVNRGYYTYLCKAEEALDRYGICKAVYIDSLVHHSPHIDIMEPAVHFPFYLYSLNMNRFNLMLQVCKYLYKCRRYKCMLIFHQWLLLKFSQSFMFEN